MKVKPELPNIDIKIPTMSATETFAQAVEGFQTATTDPLSEQLELFLKHVAKTGDIIFPWEKVQQIFIHKMKLVLNDFYQASPYQGTKVNPNLENDKFEDMRERVVQLAAEFDCPPFTFQRLCELVTDPKRNYTKCEKFIRAMEKNLMVVSPWSYSTRRTSESSDQVNGGFDMRVVNSTTERPWSNLPPSPITTNAPTIPTIKVTDSEGEDVSEADKTETETTPKKIPEGEQHAEAISTETDTTPNNEMMVVEEAKNETTPGDSPTEDNKNTKTSAEKTEDSKSEPSEEKIEPLPGVGTLVEKYNVNKQPNADGDVVSADSSGQSDSLSDITKTADATTDEKPTQPADDPVTSRSPKRKLSDEDATPMDVGSPTKRPKHDDESSGEVQPAIGES